jgi:hypothetical protein
MPRRGGNDATLGFAIRWMNSGACWSWLSRSYVGLAAFILLTWDFVVWRGWLVST